MSDDIQAELMKLPNVHTVYWGLKYKDGKVSKEMGWVCLVENKVDAASLTPDQCVPQFAIDGNPTDVIEEIPMAKMQGPLKTLAQEQQSCQSPTVPGGAQIQPQGARWVGTLGCMCISDNLICGLTNWHVTIGGQFGRNHPVTQPDSNNRSVIGRNLKWEDINFRGGENLIDAALFDCKVGNVHMLEPNQIGIGRLNPEPNTNARISDRVQKSGRTTGHTQGTVEGIQGRTSVNYGASGTALFVDQIIIRGSGRGFSAAGDSGSLVVDMDNRPYGLLFAGGGGTTIVCKIEHVIRLLGVTFYRA